jgi:CRP-like cAMP-binding protein
MLSSSIDLTLRKYDLINSSVEMGKLLSKVPFQYLSIVKGQVLYYEKTRPMGVFFIERGKIKISKIIPMSVEKMVGILTKGMMVGGEEFLFQKPYSETATAIEDTEVIYISQMHLSLYANSEGVLKKIADKFK